MLEEQENYDNDEVMVETETKNEGEMNNDVLPEVEAAENVEISAYPFETLVANIQQFTKTLGQVTWINNNLTMDGEQSKTVSIARILSNGQKQLFEITIEQKNELVFK